MIKLLFNGFRHGHVNTLYQKASDSDFIRIVGCIEENEVAKKAAESNLGAVFSDTSYDEWLKSDIDAVAIGLAYGDRGKAIIKALRAGKHIIADKPICTSLEELEEIERLSKEKNLKIICMLDLRYLPQTLKAKEILESDRLGEVKNISFNGQHFLDYAHRPSWYFEKGKHGGTVNDLAIHGIDLVRVLTGLEFSKIDAARVWNSYAYKNPDFKDSAIFMARLENGAGVLADTSYSAPVMAFPIPTYWEFRFWCQKGMLTFNYNDKKVTLYEEGTDRPIIFECEKEADGYLCELASEIKGGRRITESVIKSTKTALLIQQEADKEA